MNLYSSSQSSSRPPRAGKLIRLGIIAVIGLIVLVMFGNQGVIANGTGTDLKLIAFNMSFVGSGKDLSDDATLTIQANEVIQTNGGKIYYQTVDQSGDFRVGDAFLVNQRPHQIGRAHV